MAVGWSFQVQQVVNILYVFCLFIALSL